MIPAGTIARLATLGLSAEQAAAVADMMAEVEAATEAKVGTALAARREHDRARKARQRHVTSRDVTGHPGTNGTPPSSPSSFPPDPPNNYPSNPDLPHQPAAGAPKGADRSRGTRISPEWALDDVGRAYAVSQGLTPVEVDFEAGKFLDFWLAKAGADGRKADWSATWRTWVRSALERRGRAHGPRAGPGDRPEKRNGFIQTLQGDRRLL